jgi:uncharacterized protein (TIGR02246 family)
MIRRTIVRRVVAVLVCLGAGVAGYAAQAAEDGEASRVSLQQIVEQSAHRFAEAFEQRDAAAIAELFTEQAEYVDASGMIFHGRPAIGAEFAAAFAAQPPGKMTIELISIRPIAVGVMVEDGVSSFTPGGGPTRRTPPVPGGTSR